MHRMIERHDKGVVVGCVDADVASEIGFDGAPCVCGDLRIAALRERDQLRATSLKEALCAADGEEQSRVVGRSIGQDRAAPRVGEVVTGDGLAVGPLGVGAQIERVHQAVRGDFPTLGHPWDDCAIRGAKVDESFKEHARAAQLMLVAHALGVEREAIAALDNH